MTEPAWEHATIAQAWARATIVRAWARLKTWLAWEQWKSERPWKELRSCFQWQPGMSTGPFISSIARTSAYGGRLTTSPGPLPGLPTS